jgi:penicillin-binding protein 2
LSILVTRLATVQLIKGSYYKAVADGNGSIKRPLEPTRGVITDKNGVVLVRNAPYIQKSKDEEYLPYHDYLEKQSTPSSDLKILSIRDYQYPLQTAHLLGYTSPITEAEVKESKKIVAENKIKYGSNDDVGRTGLEEYYEELLKGIQGTELVEINAEGQVQKKVLQKEPTPGYTIQSTIDINLQNYIYSELKNSVSSAGAGSGVAVVQNPKNGQVLALVNYPSYDNNSFTHNDSKQISKFLTDSATPLLNRAIAGTYPPGSTYKMVTALAGLESQKVNVATTYDDTGSISISGITFNNWFFTQYGKSEGLIDVKKALARSNDTFFYKLSLETGVESLIDESHKFNFGKTIGMDLPGEAAGVVPTPEWKQKLKNEPWYPGNTVNMSIGQGDVLTTPIQINTMTSAIANEGILSPPVFVSTIKDGWGNELCTRDKTNRWVGEACKYFNKNIVEPKNLGIKSENLKAIQEGMNLVTKQGGTAYPFFTYSVETAGKTGTAETFQDKNPHAWYTGYAPYKNPEIAVTVLVEHGGEGSKVAAPLAKQIMEYYFKNK